MVVRSSTRTDLTHPIVRERVNNPAVAGNGVLCSQRFVDVKRLEFCRNKTASSKAAEDFHGTHVSGIIARQANGAGCPCCRRVTLVSLSSSATKSCALLMPPTPSIRIDQRRKGVKVRVIMQLGRSAAAIATTAITDAGKRDLFALR